MSRLTHGVHDALFRQVHGRTLIYNTCWEDPRLDRKMLGLGPESRVVMITSAGCSALDYLLDDPTMISMPALSTIRRSALLFQRRPQWGAPL